MALVSAKKITNATTALHVVAKKEPVRAITLPLLLDNAPEAFAARGYSLERLRKDYDISYRAALNMVLAGLCRRDSARPRQGRIYDLRGLVA